MSGRDKRAARREAVLARFGVADRIPCHYCKTPIPRAEVTLDHVYPKALGGRDETRNLVPCCLSCNQKKGSRLGTEFDPNAPCGSVLGALRCALGSAPHTIHQAVAPSTAAMKRWADKYTAQRLCR